MEPIYKKKIHK